MGVKLLKCPEDLRVYEYLLWLTRANVVVELGQNDSEGLRSARELRADGPSRYGTKSPWRKNTVLGSVNTFPSAPPSVTSNCPSSTTVRRPATEQP